MHNPRKQVRINVNYLEQEISELKKRIRLFEKERDRLKGIAASGSEKDCAAAAEYWNRYNWIALN